MVTIPLVTLSAAERPLIPLTVTHLLEHLFCPRFTYFEYVLAVPERQGKRPLVQKGREVHQERRRTNPGYLRKKLGVVQRQFDVPLASAALGVRGSVDEVLTLADGSMAPFDYKFAETPRRVYHNQRMQSALYGLLIQETFGVTVRRGFFVLRAVEPPDCRVGVHRGGFRGSAPSAGGNSGDNPDGPVPRGDEMEGALSRLLLSKYLRTVRGLP